MSTELKGLSLRGIKIEGKKTFASIPGLIQLNEMDFEVLTIVNGGNLDIRRVGDKSGLGNAIEGGSATRRGQLVTFSGAFKSMRNSDAAKWSEIRLSTLYTPLIRHQPFGIFTVYARNNNTSANYLLKHRGNAAGKFWMWVNINGATRFTFRNASNTETEWGSANGAFPVNSTAAAYDLISYGTAEAIKMEQFVNTVSVATRSTTNIAGTETMQDDLRMLETANAGDQQDLIMMAVYDWTGYTKTQIQSFMADVNAIREEKYGSIF